MIVSVFGLRDYKGKEYVNYEHVASALDSFEDVEQVISGGGKGIETLAARFASDNQIPVRVIPPNIAKYGQEVAFTRRNAEIVEACDLAIIFWDGEDPFYLELVKTILQAKKTCYLISIQ